MRSTLPCVAALAFAGVAAAGSPAQQPLPYFDQSPVVGIFGLPDASGPAILEKGQQDLTVKLDFTSHFIDSARSNETLVLDGETTRLAAVYRRGLGNGLALFAELPLIDHSAGFADGFIDEFHDVTGFKDGGRSDGPRDRQLYRYRRSGDTRLQVADSPSGLGDMRVGLAKQIWSTAAQGISINAQLKLPTGDADKLTGSGATDLALWGSWGRNGFGIVPISAVAGLGGIYTGEGDVLADRRRQAAAFGWLMLAYALTPRFAIKTQVYSHSAFYKDSDFDALTGIAAQGALGFGWRFAEASTLDLSIIEDLHFSASPDVSFNLAIKQRF